MKWVCVASVAKEEARLDDDVASTTTSKEFEEYYGSVQCHAPDSVKGFTCALLHHESACRS